VIRKYIPLWEGLQNYKRSDLNGDLSAGFIVAVMLVPRNGLCHARRITAYHWTLRFHFPAGDLRFVRFLAAACGWPRSHAVAFSFCRGFCSCRPTFRTIHWLRSSSFINGRPHSVRHGPSPSGILHQLFLSCRHQWFYIRRCNRHMPESVGSPTGVNLPFRQSMFQLFLEAGHRIGETNPVTLAIGLASIAVQVFFKMTFPHFSGCPFGCRWKHGTRLFFSFRSVGC